METLIVSGCCIVCNFNLIINCVKCDIWICGGDVTEISKNFSYNPYVLLLHEIKEKSFLFILLLFHSDCDFINGALDRETNLYVDDKLVSILLCWERGFPSLKLNYVTIEFFKEKGIENPFIKMP